ncbi:hypothetical protein [Microbacterium sp.]|uniref:hypothetical protein n=1 Tax=Microbacterium sp. TaxID=51671 RepID=UPI003C75913B
MACTYSVDDLTLSGDAHYGPKMANQPFIDYAWTSHGFNNAYWQGGWGFSDPGNVRKPVARVLNAMWLLSYSAEDYRNDSYSAPMLNWAPRYVREQLKSYDDLRAQCGTSPIARTSGCQWARKFDSWECTQDHEERVRECSSWFFLFAWLCYVWSWIVRVVCTAWGWVARLGCTLYYGTVGGGQNLTLFLSYFYSFDGTGNADVVTRAGTLVHESRHIGNKPHDGDFPAGSIYGSGSGADSSWDYHGAWKYHALYLWWFYARGTRTTLLMRNAAKQKANDILTNSFSTPTGLVVL